MKIALHRRPNCFDVPHKILLAAAAVVVVFFLGMVGAKQWHIHKNKIICFQTNKIECARTHKKSDKRERVQKKVLVNKYIGIRSVNISTQKNLMFDMALM